ncbi:MAG TPA: transporter substrate-binding domain-containing protein, partial [Actinomycetota bacterium]|nr:transporter substrate-binding domain-containing protein [Actinomycetota bacterium]
MLVSASGRVVAGVVVAALAACGLPRDPEGTLDRVEGGRMRVGIADLPPWTILGDGEPRGVEVELVEGFARSLGAEIEWTAGAPADLLTALEGREVDLVVGGFTDDDPWAQQVTFTQPYARIQTAVGAPDGGPTPTKLDGLRVAAERGTIVPDLIEDAGGIPLTVDDLADAHGLVAAEDWELRALGLRPTGLILHESRHAMAVPTGENAWL